MQVPKYILLIGFFVFVSYRPANLIAASAINTRISFNTPKKVLFASFSHTFSKPDKEDLFQISISGETIVGGQVIFDIVNFKRQQIFKTTFPALDLLGDEEDVLPTEKQKEAKIKQRFKSFFASTNFLLPAITGNEKFDRNNYDLELWKEIKADPSIIGFSYQHGYEGNYRIAYSKRKKSVVQYFYSD